MSPPRSDALVFFGATGDLAKKKIFPALQAMARRGHLDMPVIGVARSSWTVEQFRAHARESVDQHGGLDPAGFERLAARLGYVQGDYGNSATYGSIRQALATVSHVK
jgi:glucose-6-phosphate 1-dehydrogenase